MTLTPTILFEDSHTLAINKPSGMMMHGDGRQNAYTVADWIAEQYPAIIGVGDPARAPDGTDIPRPGIVHRLDQETSGVVLIAKTQESFAFLKQQFQDRTMSKEYRAFVWGHFTETVGSIDEPIGRNKNDFRRWHAGRGIRGEVREAVTNYEVAAAFTDSQGEKFSFVRLFPKTGRTHQLRVHMKFLQRPIVSDALYAPSKPKALGFDRVALHATAITFQSLSDTGTDRQTTISAPYPEDFQAALAKYGIS